MKRHRRICALCVGVVLAATSATRAQDTIQVTYGDLLQRIQELEDRQAELERMPGVDLASYESSCGFSAGGCGCDGCGCDVSGSGCGSYCGCCGDNGVYALYENVLVVPHFSRNFAFLRVDDSGPGDLFEEISFDRDLTYTPRFELGRLNGCGGLGWRARWWHLDSDAREDQNLSANQEALAAYGGSDGADIEFDQNGPSNVTAIHDLQFDVIDLEASKQCGSSLYSFGIRYANMDQEYMIFSPTDDGIYGQHDFEGLGPTIAGEWYHPVSCRVQVFAKARGSLLYGRSTFYAVDIADGSTSDVIYRQNDYDLLTVGELQLGVDWRVPVGCSSTFFVTAALEGQAWLNAGSGAPGLLDDDDGNYQDESAQSSDLGVVGVTIGTGLIF